VNLLADIGGTHVRFALAKDGQLYEPQKLKAAEFSGFKEATEHYLGSIGECATGILAATAAWPDEHGVFHFSNQTGWDFNPQVMRDSGYQLDRLFNDFEAAGYGALSPNIEQKDQLKSGRSGRDYPVLICGPGTGLGLAYALPVNDTAWRVQPTFGAKMLVCCYTQEQHEIAMIGQKMLGDDQILQFEHVASGRGLILLHEAVCKMLDKPVFGDSAQEILDNAHEESAQVALRLFHEFLGLFIHSMIMTTHSYGGVYLAGGMVDRLMERDMFDFKAIETYMLVPVCEYVSHVIEDTPVFSVRDPFLALKGLLEADNYTHA